MLLGELEVVVHGREHVAQWPSLLRCHSAYDVAISGTLQVAASAVANDGLARAGLAVQQRRPGPPPTRGFARAM